MAIGGGAIPVSDGYKLPLAVIKKDKLANKKLKVIYYLGIDQRNSVKV